MKLVLLGTTGYHPNDRRQTACFMLPELGVVFDAGTGFYRVGDYLQTDTLDIFLTHVHLDHSIGLTYAFDLRYVHPLERVTAYVEQTKLNAVREHLLTPMLFPVAPPVDLEPLPPEVTLADGSRLTHFPLRHPGGSVGFRIDWPDRSLAYVTDTVAAADADYIKHLRNVDVLIHECYFNDEHADQAELTGHSCLSQVARVAAAAEVGRLVLVHVNPLVESDDEVDLEAARKIFANTELGVDRMELDF